MQELDDDDDEGGDEIGAEKLKAQAAFAATSTKAKTQHPQQFKFLKEDALGPAIHVQQGKITENHFNIKSGGSGRKTSIFINSFYSM